MSDTKLKPCPFCGGEAVVIGVSTIWCENEDCGCEFTNINKEKLINAWNTRKPIDRIVEQLEERRKDYERSIQNALDDISATYRKGVMRGYEYSKDVVKAGGIDG